MDLRKLCGNRDKGELYTAYTSNDGEIWTKGGTWQHQLGSSAQIGIAAENTTGFTMDFDMCASFV